MTTLRQEKVNSLLQKEIASYILEEGFPDLTGLVTITGVQVSADMGQAQVFVSAVGQNEEEVLKILQNHIYQIQGMLNRKLKMRKVPRLTFVADHSGAYAQHIQKLIKKVHSDGG